MNISICITSYYRDIFFINRLLKELAIQTLEPYEIILYCSGLKNLINIPTDIIINNKSVPIYCIHSYKQTIQSIARNICSSVASGDIIIFFDIDDIPHFQKIEITNYVFSHNNIEFFLHNYGKSKSDFRIVDIDNMTLVSDLSVDNNSTNVNCMNYPIHHAHIAVRKKIFNNIRFNEDILAYRKEDGLFCQSLLNQKYKGIYTTEKLVVYT